MTAPRSIRLADIGNTRGATKGLTFLTHLEGNARGGSGPILIITGSIESPYYLYDRCIEVVTSSAQQVRPLLASIEQEPLLRFEKILQRINDNLATFTSQEGAAMKWDQIHILVAELSPNYFCLSAIGKPTAIYFQPTPEGAWKGFNLLSSLDQPEIVDPTKPFAALLSGDLQAQDILVLGSHTLDAYRQDLRLKERLTTSPLVSATFEITQDLQQRGLSNSIAGIAARVEENIPNPTPVDRAAPIAPIITETATTEPEVVRQPAAPPVQRPSPTDPTQTPTSSIERLRRAEQAAESHLGPQRGPLADVKAIAHRVKGSISQLFTRKPLRSSTGSPVSPSPRPLRDPVTLAGLRAMRSGIGTAWTRDKKVLLGVGVMLIVLGAAGHSYWKKQQTLTVERAAWNASADQIADLRDQAERDATYGNESRARSEIAEAEQKILTLPRDLPERAQRLDALSQGLVALKERLRRSRTVDPATVYSLGPSTPEGGLSAPLLLGDAAYVADNAGKQIIRIALGDRSTKAISLPPDSEAVIGMVAAKGRILAATKDGRLFAVSADTNTLSALFWSGASSSTKDIFLYTNKLYRLDPEQNQIFRSTAAGTGFGSGSGYLKAASTNLKNAVALAIDSSVYALQSDGTLSRFLSGAQEGFSLAAIDPPLRSASGLWTETDVPALLITDPTDKRLLLFTKEGQLIAQLTSSQFLAPKDVSADYSTKRALIVDGNRLFLVALP